MTNDQFTNAELAQQLRLLAEIAEPEEATTMLSAAERLSVTPAVEPTCECIPLAPRNGKFCQDCGGRISGESTGKCPHTFRVTQGPNRTCVECGKVL